MRYTDFKQKEVIDCKDGRRLGFVVDLEFEPCDACIHEILVPMMKGGFECFKKPKIMRIPYHNIVKIGPDIILVQIPERKG
jgi:YlmC/YmxH family sporulation protein